MKDKHWTLLELTAINGDHIMCVVIFAGKRQQTVVETGCDVFAAQEGNMSEESFFERIATLRGELFQVDSPVSFREKKFHVSRYGLLKVPSLERFLLILYLHWIHCQYLIDRKGENLFYCLMDTGLALL